MDHITRGFMLGCLTFFVLFAASFALGGAMERSATQPVDAAYSPEREAIVDAWGMPLTQHRTDGTARAAHAGVSFKGRANGPS